MPTALAADIPPTDFAKWFEASACGSSMVEISVCVQ